MIPEIRLSHFNSCCVIRITRDTFDSVNLSIPALIILF